MINIAAIVRELYTVGTQTITIFILTLVVSLQNYPKSLDLSYRTNQDFQECFCKRKYHLTVKLNENDLPF